MAQVLTDEQNLTDIADAIRAKSSDEHKTDTWRPSEMAAAIRAIEGGGMSEVESVTINNKAALETIEMPADGSYAAYPISVTVLPARAPQMIKVLISNPEICEARENGDGTYSLRPKRGGTFTVTVTDYSGQITDTATVNVDIPLQSMIFAAARTYCEEGQTHETHLITTPRNANIQGMTYESSNTSVATVNSNGVVSVVGPGEVTITATSANNITATCIFESTSAITDPNWGAIKAAVLDGTSTLAVGSTISDKWVERYGTTTREFDVVWRVVHIGDVELENGTIIHNAPTLLLESALPRYIPFHTMAKVVATEETALEGVLYYGNTGSTYTKLDVETGDILPYGTYTNIYKTSLELTGNHPEYAVSQSYLAIWKYSTLRQWLNSDADKGNWWAPQHINDTNSAYPDFYGFLSGFSAAFLNAISPVKVQTQTHPDLYASGTIHTTYDKMYVPSMQQIYATTTSATAPDIAWDYFKDQGGTSSPTTSNMEIRKRIALGSNSSSTWWLRSPNSYYTEYNVRGTGSTSSNTASYTYYVAPACTIC